MSLWELLLILTLCLLSEGFFTGAELAVVNVDKFILRSKLRKGETSAKLVLSFLNHPGWFFSATLLGTNLAVVTASVCTTYFIVGNFGEAYEGWALLLAPILLIFGEIVPKSIYQHHSNSLAFKAAYPVKIFGLLLFPIVFVLTKLNDIFLGKASKQFAAQPPVTREELENLLKEEVPAMENPPLQRTMISKIFDLAEKRAINIMTPLVDIKAIPNPASREETTRAFEESGHSRLPVFQGRVTNMVGILHNIDFLLADPIKTVTDLVRLPFYVPEEMAVDDLLITMKEKREAIAIVVDEYGGATGLLTLEDMIEEVVGDIRDEYEKPLPLYYRMGKNRLLVSGRLEIAEANEKLKLGIPEGDYETIAGFLIHQLGYIPKAEATYRFGNLSFTVRRATERAIQDIEILVQP